MQRRDFLSLLGAAAATSWPQPIRAQQAMPIIGFLHSADSRSFAAQLKAFHQGLKEGGFEEGRNVTVEYRWAEGHFDRLPAMAADLVSHQVSVLVATGGPSIGLIAKAATGSIPIVFTSGVDPVKLGLVTNLSRPGGNVTGVYTIFGDLVAKQIGLLHQLIPGATTAALLVNPARPDGARQSNDARAAARGLGIDIKVVNASIDAEIVAAFEAIAQMRVGALIVGGDPFFGSRVALIVAEAARRRIPAMYYRREYVAAGGLMSYGTNINDGYRQNGIYVTKILKGAKPADLPIVQAAKFEFAINLKTARSLGLELHPQLLAIADEVIE
jgi:putative ABC transport system substrate-binding protein